MWRLTDEQRQLRDEIRGVVLEEIRPLVLKMEETEDYPYPIHRILADHGYLGLAIPKEYGGQGDDEISFCAYIEELSKISGTVGLIAAYVELVSRPIILAGTDEQKARFLPGLASGELLGSYALSEPDVGSDPAGLTTHAERNGDTWILNGQKRFIGNSGISDVYVVFARTGGPGAKGISAFLVPADAEGVSSEPLPTMGMPGWKLGSPKFENVELPHENLLGEEGHGFKLAMTVFDLSRPVVAAQAVGVGQGAVDLALDYAVRRHAFGQPLLGHQGVQFKLAEMEAEVAAARALAYQAANFADDKDPRMTKIAAAAKMVASDTAMRVTTEAVQILGGNGYLRGFPAERMMRDAKVLQIYEGANEIQKLVIARQMAAQAEARDPVWPEMMPGSEGVAAGQTKKPGEEDTSREPEGGQEAKEADSQAAAGARA